MKELDMVQPLARGAALDTGEALPVHGLSEAEVRARRQRGEGNDTGAAPSRSYWDIARANLFTLFNNILFVLGVALIALGRVNDALTSVGLGLVNACISTVQEIRAKRQLDQIALVNRTTVTVIREGRERVVDPGAPVPHTAIRPNCYGKQWKSRRRQPDSDPRSRLPQ